MQPFKQYPLIILANGLGTRMAISRPKTLIKLATDQTILSRLINEACSTRVISRIIVFIRKDTEELRGVIQNSSLPIEVIVREPSGYFRDLIAAKKALDLKDFSVVDSDLVAPYGELTDFWQEVTTQPSWLTIGITRFPEQSSGRPTWVDVNDDGQIKKMSRSVVMPCRTVGIFYWSDAALRIQEPVNDDASIMAYISDHLHIDARGILFSRAVNVNTKEDIDTANRLLARR